MQFQVRIDAGSYVARIEVVYFRPTRQWRPALEIEIWCGRIGGNHVAIDVDAEPKCLAISIRTRKWHHWSWRLKDTKAALLAWWKNNMAAPEQPIWWR